MPWSRSSAPPLDASSSTAKLRVKTAQGSNVSAAHDGAPQEAPLADLTWEFEEISLSPRAPTDRLPLAPPKLIVPKPAAPPSVAEETALKAIDRWRLQLGAEVARAHPLLRAFDGSPAHWRVIVFEMRRWRRLEARERFLRSNVPNGRSASEFFAIPKAAAQAFKASEIARFKALRLTSECAGPLTPEIEKLWQLEMEKAAEATARNGAPETFIAAAITGTLAKDADWLKHLCTEIRQLATVIERAVPKTVRMSGAALSIAWPSAAPLTALLREIQLVRARVLRHRDALTALSRQVQDALEEIPVRKAAKFPIEVDDVFARPTQRLAINNSKRQLLVRQCYGAYADLLKEMLDKQVKPLLAALHKTDALVREARHAVQDG